MSPWSLHFLFTTLVCLEHFLLLILLFMMTLLVNRMIVIGKRRTFSSIIVHA
jgi:hypothetical protein